MDVTTIEFYEGDNLLKSSCIAHENIRNLLMMKDFSFGQKSYQAIRSIYNIDSNKYCIYLQTN